MLEDKVKQTDLAFNKDVCYQLTAIGCPGPNLHIAVYIATRYHSNDNMDAIIWLDYSGFRG